MSGVMPIKVYLRLKPMLNNTPMSRDEGQFWLIQENRMISSIVHPEFAYCFDQIFDGKIQCTKNIFDSIATDLLQRALSGVNASILAYGPTSTGKTFTMMGTPENPGIIPLSLKLLFDETERDLSREYSFRLSMMEIYNESVSDLLFPEKGALKISESWTKGVFISNLSEEPISTIDEALFLLARGEQSRHVGETRINEQSSRSHAIIRLTLESRNRQSAEGTENRLSINRSVLESTITFVDLAGSEKPKVTGADGLRLKEGAHINTSLLALTRVIAQLSKEKDRHHVSYRDSKLTRILQDSLGGNSVTTIICTSALSEEHHEETLNTLKFASSAKAVVSRAKVNEKISDRDQVQRLIEENRQLKLQIEELYGGMRKRHSNPNCLSAATMLLSELYQTKQSLASVLDDCVRIQENTTIFQSSIKSRILQMVRNYMLTSAVVVSELYSRPIKSISVLPRDNVEAMDTPMTTPGNASMDESINTNTSTNKSVDTSISTTEPGLGKSSLLQNLDEEVKTVLEVFQDVMKRFNTMQFDLVKQRSIYESCQGRIKKSEELVRQRESEVAELLVRITEMQTKLCKTGEDWGKFGQTLGKRCREALSEISTIKTVFTEDNFMATDHGFYLRRLNSCKRIVASVAQNHSESLKRGFVGYLRDICAQFKDLKSNLKDIGDACHELSSPNDARLKRIVALRRTIVTSLEESKNSPLFQDWSVNRKEILKLRILLERNKERTSAMKRQLELRIIELQDELATKSCNN